MRLRLSSLVVVLALAALCAGGRAQAPAPSCRPVTVESKVKNPLWVTGDPGVCPGAVVVFTAAVSGAGPKDEPGFHWTVSGGEIVSGQGTPSITVQPQENEEPAVTATVQVSGVSRPEAECEMTASATVGKAACGPPPCPTLTLTCPTEVVQAGTPFTVTASLSGGEEPELEITYNWAVSAGVIVSGQGTPTITVDTKGLAGQHPTVTIEVGGFHPECDRTESCTPPVARIGRRVWRASAGFRGSSGK